MIMQKSFVFKHFFFPSLCYDNLPLSHTSSPVFRRYPHHLSKTDMTTTSHSSTGPQPNNGDAPRILNCQSRTFPLPWLLACAGSMKSFERSAEIIPLGVHTHTKHIANRYERRNIYYGSHWQQR